MLQGACFAATNMIDLVKLIEAKAASNDWVVTKDFQSITLTKKKVLILNSIQLPPWPEDKIWNELSSQSDFRITINWDTLLSQYEYENLSILRNNFIIRRTLRLPPDSIVRGETERAAAPNSLYCLYIERKIIRSIFIARQTDTFIGFAPNRSLVFVNGSQNFWTRTVQNIRWESK